jgi:integrase
MTKKKGNGEGSIYEHKRNGKRVGYRGAYWVHTAGGPKRRYVSGKTRAEVAQKLTKVMAERDGGLVFDAGTLTLGEYLKQWLSSSVRDTVRIRTFERYEQICRVHLIPALGRVKLTHLTPAHVRALYREKLDAGLSPRTVEYIHTTLHKALKQAVMDGLIPRNVTDAVKAPRAAKKEVHPLTPEEVQALLEKARGDRLEALYLLAITAGLREGELLGLKWDDVDFAAGTLSVRRTLSQTKQKGPTLTSTKNSRGRSVKLAPTVLDALRHHKAVQNAERLNLGTLWEDHGLIFPAQTGKPMRPWVLYRGSFKRLLDRAGIKRPARFHDLRHTCATLLIKKNINPKIIQELLGHSTITTTLNTYSHVLPTMQDQAAEAMESVVS